MLKRRTAPAPDLPATTHFILQCFHPEQADITRSPLLAKPLDNWLGGKRWTMEVPTPLAFEIDEEDEGTMIPFFNDVMPLMRSDLLDALREAGVDNIDDYAATVRETRTGRKHTNYRVINIVGTLAAADLAASDVDPSTFDGRLLIDAFFRRLQLNAAAAKGALFFRLAEKVSAILVHTNIRHHLVERDIESLVFVHPAEWSG